jgi:hypothetical protein
MKYLLAGMKEEKQPGLYRKRASVHPATHCVLVPLQLPDVGDIWLIQPGSKLECN